MERKEHKRKSAPRRGRPPLPMREGKRHALGLRVTAERRQALEDAAAKSGRSLSQEIELRIEQSFADEAAFGGREMIGLFRMMAGAAAMIEARRGGKTWSSDWETFQAVREAWRKLIDGVRPSMPPEWREKFDVLDAAGPGDLPKMAPWPTAPKRLGPPMMGDILGVDPATWEARQREYDEWKKAQDEWLARAEHHAKIADAYLKHFRSLADLGREAASQFLVSPLQLADGLARSANSPETSKKE